MPENRREALRETTTPRRSLRFALGAAAAGGLGADTQVPPLDLLEVEPAAVAHEVAQLPETEGANVEIRHQIYQHRSDGIEPDPPILAFDLCHGLFQNRNGGSGRLQRPRLGCRTGVGRGHLRHQILRVDKAAARLPKTFRSVLFAEPVDVGALFT